MKKKIKFYSVDTSTDILKPAPALRFIPRWYRSIPGVRDGVMSVKKCVPVLDAFSAGYIVPLPADVVWDKASGRMLTQSRISLESDHHKSQIEGFDVGDGYDPTPHKWLNPWFIKVPRGYSVLFTHPLNREDLPFKAFTGVVDCDKHPMPVNFPFVFKEGFEGTVPAGTPMIQLIPFKRETWFSKIVDTGKSYSYEKGYEVLLPPFKWYKRNFWTRKKYQ